MKKLTLSILILLLISSSVLFSGCASKEEITLTEKIEMKVTAYRTDLEDSMSTLSSPEKVAEYLTHWADSKGIAYRCDDHNNVVMEVETSEAYAQAPPTVVVCPYDTMQMQNSVAPLSLGLYLAKNNEGTGRLKVIFTDNSGNMFRGISSLSGEYFTDDSNVFCLSSGSVNIWSMRTGARSSYEFKGHIQWTDPVKNKAYRISIENLPGGVPDFRIGSYPNPIKLLGNLLAEFKTNAFIYELADFTGGTVGNLYPESASITVVIEADDCDNFLKRIEDDIEDFNDQELDDFPDATYSCEEVDVPEKVLTAESADGLVSLIYTLLNGIYYKDASDETFLSFTNIGSIKHDDSSCTILASADSLNSGTLQEIDNNYQLICGLSDVAYMKTDSQEGWSSDTSSGFASQISEAYSEYTGKTMTYDDFIAAASSTYVHSLNDKCNIVNLSVNTEELERYTGAILTFMLDRPHEESQMAFKNH